MTVIIYFVGLIAHFTLSPPQGPFKMEVAALVVSENEDQTPNHRAELIVSKSAVLSSVNPFKSSPPQVGDMPDLLYYDLSGVGVVRVLGLSTVSMDEWSPDFRNNVRSLSEATGHHKLAKHVLDETFSDVSAFVELEGGGQLSVAGYYKYTGKHTPTMTTAECVPSLVQYSGHTVGDVIEFVSSTGHHLRVSLTGTAPAKIYFANLPTTSGMPSHFGEYAKLVNADNAGTWAPGDVCPSTHIFDPGAIGRGNGKGDSIDCTNTHFP